MKWLKVSVLGMSLLVAGCQSVSTTNSSTIGVDRQQRMFSMLSEQEVNQMSEQAYGETLKQARKDKVLNTNAVTVQRLRTISDNLVTQVGVFRPDAPRWNWEVNLIESKQLNAYCMPGGKIMFYSGIIDKLELNDNEIAAIMGHEIAHALREHGRESMSQAYALEMGKNTLGILLGVSQQTMALGGTLANYALTLPNSRTNEVEADLIGLELMARAGYDPKAAVTLWQKMEKASESAPPEFMSTHPAHGTRIDGLEANLIKVQPLFESAKK